MTTMRTQYLVGQPLIRCSIHATSHTSHTTQGPRRSRSLRQRPGADDRADKDSAIRQIRAARARQEGKKKKKGEKGKVQQGGAAGDLIVIVLLGILSSLYCWGFIVIVRAWGGVMLVYMSDL